MNPNAPNQDGSDSLVEFIAHAQHDLRNPLGNILGFCEILGQQLKDAPNQDLRRGLETISQWAEQMAEEIDHVLDPNKTPPGPEAVKALQGQLRHQTAGVINKIQNMSALAGVLDDTLLCQDLSRMADSAARLARVIETSLSAYPDRQ